MIFGLSLFLWGCARSGEPASPSGEAYGYEDVDDPLAEADAAEAKLPTSCARMHCSPPRVCRLISTKDPGGGAHAYCLGPDDDLCKIDPELCHDGTCRTDRELCR